MRIQIKTALFAGLLSLAACGDPRTPVESAPQASDVAHTVETVPAWVLREQYDSLWKTRQELAAKLARHYESDVAAELDGVDSLISQLESEIEDANDKDSDVKKLRAARAERTVAPHTVAAYEKEIANCPADATQPCK